MSPKLPRVGSIYGDLGVVAADVQRACVSTSLVWTDDIGGVFVGPTSSAVQPQSIIGMFTAGCPVGDILDDLQAMRTERARHWIQD